MTSAPKRGLKAPAFATLLAGLAAAAGQVLLLRELLALFGGYEPAAAALLAGWLLWGALGSFTAGRLAARRSTLTLQNALGWTLALLGALAPCSLLLARLSPLFLEQLGLPAGVRPSLGALAGVSLLAPGAFCFLAGAVFGIAWQAANSARKPPLQIYLAEALGAALGGGAVFIFLAMDAGQASALSLAFWLFGLCLVGGLLLLQGRRRTACGLLGAAVLTGGLLHMPQLEAAGLHWRWGPDAVAARDTPLQRVAMLLRQGERSYFGGSGWLFTVPDAYSAEWAVHPPLLVHENPERVLLIGGSMHGPVREASRHPSVEEVLFLEPDRGLLAFVQNTVPKSMQRFPIGQAPVILVRDPLEYARSLARKPDGGQDVILLNAGEPVNAQTSRLYSLEFLRLLKGCLRPGGVLCFGLPASPNALGPAQEAQLRSLWATAAEVFAHVEVTLGAQALLFCSDAPLELDAQTLAQRLRKRSLQPDYVRQEALIDLLSPFTRDYVQALLQQGEKAPVNRVLQPSAYYHSAVLWLHELPLGRLLRNTLSWLRTPEGRFAPWLLALTGGALLVLPRRAGRSVPLAVLLSGAAGLALEMGLLLAYQGLAGSLYSRLALLVGAWMSGLGLGAWLTGSTGSRRAGPAGLRELAAIQAVLCLALAGGGPFLQLLLDSGVPAPWTPIFTLLCLAGGMLGGAHFALAVSICAATGATTGATLYALDLAGAAVGAFVAGLLLAPLLGVSAGLGLIACLLAGSCLSLLRTR